MRSTFGSILFVFIVLSAWTQELKPGSRIIVQDAQIHDLVPEDAGFEILGRNFTWTEGPLWLPSEEKLIFSDIPENSVYEWSEREGIKLYLKPSGYTGNKERRGESGSNGLLLSPDGKLVLCMHGDRRMARMVSPVSNPDAEFETLADRYHGKKLNSPNDAVYNRLGELFFTDPPYGLEKGMKDPEKDLDFQGVFKVDKSGRLTLLTEELSRPNGISFSPDEKKMYVANSDPGKAVWMEYNMSENNIPDQGRIFYDATDMVSRFKGLPDGLKVHPNGWIFATGPGGVWIFTPEGKHLGTLFTGEATSNCAFNEDHSVLFMTADDYLLRIKLKPAAGGQW